MDEDRRRGSAAERAADPFARTDPPVLALTLLAEPLADPNGAPGSSGSPARASRCRSSRSPAPRRPGGCCRSCSAPSSRLWFAIRRSCADGRLTEELRLWPDLITVVRREPRRTVRRWHANPFWVRLRLPEDGRIEKYLTLKGNGREIELGAFLSPWERETLYEAETLRKIRCGRLRGARQP